MIIAIDGLAGVGKTSAALGTAEKLGIRCMDTGAMFRSIAYKVIKSGNSPDDEIASTKAAEKIDLVFEYENGSTKPTRVLVDGEDVTSAIREPEMSDGSSRVSVWPGVRAAVLAMERETASTGDFVVEGRDIGTVVFPEADVKIFLTAKTPTRAERRKTQYEQTGSESANLSLDELAQQLEERDQRDSQRALAPCVPAEDAIVLVTDELTLAGVIDRICELTQLKDTTTTQS